MKNYKNVATPMEVKKKFISESESEEDMKGKPYYELVGSYLTKATRPDITFVTNALSRFYENPKIAHGKAAKHVLKYFRRTTKYAINYEKSDAKLIR